jgi:outer membrane receptor protein involved in Fe transport
MKTVSRLPALTIISLALTAPFVFAQGYKAAIVGRITDRAGAVIRQARVTVTNIETNLSVSTLSDENGHFLISPLIPGRYRVNVEADGFRGFVREGITLEVEQTARVDLTLAIGPVTDMVVVKSGAPTITTENSSLGQVITNREILDLPLNGRNYLSLALLAPGVLPVTDGANPHSINGARSDHVSYLIEGVSNINRRGNEPVASPSIDAIQEFKIVTHNFSADYGRLGGGVISVALKNGTNQFHGSLFEFLRNDALDARGFFDQSVPKLKRHQFGGVLAGPILKERTFFLLNYEGLRNREEQTRITRVPTDQEREGIFSAPIRNPFTGQPFLNNTIPNERLSPVALKTLNLIPRANRNAALNFITLVPLSSNNDSLIAKVDHRFSQSDSLTARFLLSDFSGSNPARSTPLPGFGALRRGRKQQWSLTHTHIFSSSLVNEARFGFVRDNFAERSVNAGRNTATEVGINGVPAGFGLTNISIAGFPEFGDATFLPDEWTDNEYILSNTLSRTMGKHYLRIGGDFQRSQHFNLFAAFAAGQAVFLGSFSGNALADFLLGLPTATQRQVGTNKSYLFSNYFGLFLQDDWKVHPDLTLNLGVRYDVNQPPVEKYDRLANFIPSLRRQVRVGEPGFPRSLLKTDYNNISPRLGFAYRPFGNERTVIRGGYGIFNSFDLQFTLYQLLGASAFPFTRLEQFLATGLGNPSLTDPFPSNRPGATPAASTPNGWQYDNPTPYLQSWNLSVARELTASLGVEVAYVGTKGTHQSVTLNINQTIRTPQGNIAPFPGFGRILVQNLGANSNYHALQVSAQKRFSSALGFRSSFTWSKAIDQASFGSAARQPQDPRNLRAERALADFDRRRVWSNDFVFELPFGRGRRFSNQINRELDAVLGGWRLSGIIFLADGRPFTPVIAGANAQAGFATRPDRLRDGKLDAPTIERWFDPTAFAVVPASAFRFGNSGRNILTGPGIVSIDASVFKQFSLPWEAHRLEFRADFFNLPNHANFDLPARAIDQPTAGSIGSAGPGRQIQFALRYIF